MSTGKRRHHQQHSNSAIRHLPALPVHIGDHFGHECEVVGQVTNCLPASSLTATRRRGASAWYCSWPESSRRPEPGGWQPSDQSPHVLRLEWQRNWWLSHGYGALCRRWDSEGWRGIWNFRGNGRWDLRHWQGRVGRCNARSVHVHQKRRRAQCV